MAINKRFFDDQMRDRKISLRQVAKLMDTSPSQLSRTLSGHRRMQLSEAVSLAQILGVGLAELMVHSGIEQAQTEQRFCPVIGILQGDLTISPVDKNVRERVAIPLGDLPENVQAIQARTADSPFAFLDGWLFFIGPETDPADLVGTYAVCQVEGGSQIIGTIQRGYQPRTYNVTGAAGITRQSQPLTWARRIYFTQHG